MTYTQNIPDAPNNPSQDQPLMKANTNAIFTLIGTDHINFNLPNSGNHDIIKQPPQSGDPALAAGKGQTYTKTIAGDQQLFYESGAGIISQLTNGVGTLALSNGYTFLPGGMILQWGVVTPIASNGSVLFVTSNVDFPTNCFGVVATITGNGASTVSISTSSPAITGFSWHARTTSSFLGYTGFFWMAIGN